MAEQLDRWSRGLRLASTVVLTLTAGAVFAMIALPQNGWAVTAHPINVFVNVAALGVLGLVLRVLGVWSHALAAFMRRVT